MTNPEGSGREPAREARRLMRKERRHAERRRAILDAARRLLVKSGTPCFTVSAVAAVAQVSKPAVYYYFESKEELVAALAAEVLHEETLVLRQAVTSAPDGAEVLVAMSRAYVEYHIADLPRFRILYAWSQVLELGARLAQTDAQAARRTLDDEIAGRLRRPGDPLRLVQAARATAHGLVCMASLGTEPGPTATRIAQMCDDICRALWRTSAAP
jgi:TetR/AcrR family transcriptional regulator